MWNEIKIESWQHFNQVITSFNSKGWIFRGQSSLDWCLESSLYRECKKAMNNVNNHVCFSIEKQMTSEFISSYKLYSNHRFTEYPNSEEPSEWLEEKLSALSIMQHYGTPTRLLDWTYSPYIATFFALDGATNNFCIYALNISIIEKYNKEILDIDNSYERYRIFNSNYKVKRPFLYSYDPLEKNERIRRQQGLFIVPSFIDMSIDDILNSYGIKNGKLNGEEIATKFTISNCNFKEWWFRLIQMNITHETIYPGLEGFCKSLKLNTFK